MEQVGGKCGICGVDGHNKRKCPNKSKSIKKPNKKVEKSVKSSKLKSMDDSARIVVKPLSPRLRKKLERRDNSLDKLSRKELYNLYEKYRIEVVKRINLENDIVLSELELRDRELKLKDIKRHIDMIDLSPSDKKVLNKREFVPLPDLENNDFIDEISMKAEFFNNKLDLNMNDDICNTKNIELGNHQILIKNFLNDKTPYKSLLIFHGVGVGKTCTAITASECFQDYFARNNKKIICLASGNLHDQWRDTIYNKNNKKCPSTNITNVFDNDRAYFTDGVDLRIKKHIDKYYEFMGYLQFANRVESQINKKIRKEITPEERKKIEIDVIKEIYSNRLLIVDEIHNLRDSSDIESPDNLARKQSFDYLNKVLKYSDNLRLILLSATPMYDNSKEIINILNYLLLNDNKTPIEMKEIFNSKGLLTRDGMAIINRKCRGYVSYLRGENPISFPIRLYPDVNNDKKCLIPNRILDKNDKLRGIDEHRYPKKDKLNIDIVDDIKFLKLYKNKLEGNQLNYYENISLSGGILNDEELLQSSNIIFPSMDDGIFNTGMEGFNNIFDKTKKSFKYKPNILKKYGPILHKDNIREFSSKLSNILDIIDNSDGIILIYSKYLWSGLVPLSLALEHFGFNNYKSNLLDSDKKMKNKKLNYVLFTANKLITPYTDTEKKNLFSTFNSSDNKEGKNIKIILTNISEGLDLKRIREVHILEPWYHLNEREQIIGRGIRFCSHKDLNSEKRNVTIYLHVSFINEKETRDIEMYRIAEKKAIEMGKVELILKKNSIDCYLNNKINIIKFPITKKIITSKGIEKVIKVKDEEYSKVCSFSDNCEYDCNISLKKFNELNFIDDNELNYDTINYNFLKDKLNDVKNIIKNMYTFNNHYNLDDIISNCKKYKDINYKLILISLNDMISNYKDNILINNKNEQGYIIYKNSFYLFQPINSNNLDIPSYYRNYNKLVINDIPLEYIELNKISKTIFKINKNDFDDNTIHDLIRGEILKFFNYVNNNELIIFINEKSKFISDLNKVKYTIESLSYNIKFYILSFLIFNYEKLDELGKMLYIDLKVLFNNFKYNFIYKDKQQYKILQDINYDVNMNPCGFFLFNDDEFTDRKFINNLNNFNFYIQSGNNIQKMDDSKKTYINSFIKKHITTPEFYKIFTNSNNPIWGYGFIDKFENHTLKIVTTSLQSVKPIPGQIIKEISSFNSDVIEKIKLITKNNIILSVEDIKKNKKLFNKDNICLLFELLLYKYNLYINYDLFLLKYYK
jgi:hypothetical protein